jgi:hypothetical protein
MTASVPSGAVRAPVLVLIVLLLTAGAAACGGDEAKRPDPEREVRAALDVYVRAVAAKDYDTLCDRVFAEELLADLRRVELSCEVALQRGLQDVERPTLVVRSVRVQDDRGTADAVVRTDAANQPPSDDTVRLIRRGGRWRIAALAS